MMPKSTATMMPVGARRTDCPGACRRGRSRRERVAQEGPDHVSASSCGGRARRRAAPRDRDRDAVDPLHRQHVAGRCAPSHHRARGNRGRRAYSRQSRRGRRLRAAGPARAAAVCASVSVTSTGRRRRRDGMQRSSSRAARHSSFRGRAEAPCACRAADLDRHLRCRRRASHLAGCTWAMEAAATGSPKLDEKVVDRPAQRAFDRHRPRCRSGTCAMRSCSSARSSATSSPTMSGRVARNWPNLT